MKAKSISGVLMTTRAGNSVWRIKGVSKTESFNHVMYDADLLFDSACETATPKSVQIELTNLVPFDALRLGLLWNQLRILSEELSEWSEANPDEATER